MMFQHKLMKQTGFALVKAFGVEGIGQMEVFIVKVVAKFVQKGAQKGLERYDAAVLGCAHPERYDSKGPSFCRFVQPMQFAPGSGRTIGEHLDAERLDGKAVCDAQGKLPANIFHQFPVLFY